MGDISLCPSDPDFHLRQGYDGQVGNLANNPSAYLRFTALYAPMIQPYQVDTDGSNCFSSFTLRDCEVYGGGDTWELSVPSNSVFGLTNNLFQYTQLNASVSGQFSAFNNLYRGTNGFYNYNLAYNTYLFCVTNAGGGSITNRDNAFDGASVNTAGTNGHNAYLNNASVISAVLTNDIVTNMGWVGGPLGNYYQDASTTLNREAEQPPLQVFTIVGGVETDSTLDALGRTDTVLFTDNGYVIGFDQYFYVGTDPTGRSYVLKNINGLETTNTFDCCGLSSTRDPDGILTLYYYDSMKRLTNIQVSRSPSYVISAISVYDGLGRTVATQRQGADGSVITQSQTAYDALNRVMLSTNALGGVTTTTFFTNSGQPVITNTFPDGGTSVEIFYLDGGLQFVTGTAVQPVHYTNYVTNDSGSFRQVQKAIKLDASGSDTSEWTESILDGAGRAYKTVYASAGTNYPFAISYYNTNTNDSTQAGLLTNSVDPDGVSTLYLYNNRGGQNYIILDVNQNSNIDWSGPDRITFTTNDVLTDNGVNVSRSRMFTWSINNSAASNLVSSVATAPGGLTNWTTNFVNGVALSSTSATAYLGNAIRVTTNMAPDGTYTVNSNLYGRLISVTQFDNNGTQVGQVTNGYDAHGRQNVMCDARNGTTMYYFNNADQIVGTVTPVPATGLSAEVTSNYFDTSERMIETKLPDATYTSNLLNPTGLAYQAYGSREYPVGNGYDPQGRMTKMTNWTTFPSAGARVTTWNYDPYRGWLSSKVYDDGKGPVYTNTAAGRLQTRLWARGTNTSYGYNTAGDLAAVSYNDGLTPTMSNGYDRLGRKIIVTNGATLTMLTLNDAGQTLIEAYSGGPLSGWSVTNGYDSFLRRTNMVVVSNTTQMWSNAFTYNPASRLATVSDGTNSAAYSYLANSPLVSNIVFKQSGTTRMTTTKQFDLLNRLTSIGTTNASSVTISSSAYAYNSANQRTSVTNEDGSYWLYGYDSLGQVTSASKYWSDNTPVAGAQFGNAFDNIGNRNSAQFGGNAGGTGLLTSLYTANDLNQYTSRTVPGFIDVLGTATNTATVTVNGNAAYRHGSFFESELPVENEAAPAWQFVTTQGALSGTNVASNVTGNVFLPENPENYVYDKDGNLSTDGRFANSWDAENRLTTITSLSGAATGSLVKLDITYDYMGRRIQKIVSTNNGSWTPEYTNKFIYDGWNVIAVLDGGNNLIRSFLWGTDLSGSGQGAGGVGGLISMTIPSGAMAGTYFYCYDGNGNATATVNAANANIAAQYEYGPFGEVIRATGPMAFTNPFRFSTKYQDEETGLAYYGYRFYNPNTGRWLSRDPIAEIGGNNLYAFIHNEAISAIDKRGLCDPGSCGPDITASLNRTLLSIQKAFWQADEDTKHSACTALYDVLGISGSWGGKAWDITPLYDAGLRKGSLFDTPGCGNNSVSKNGTGTCSLTVTVKGSCVWASAANYAMWGTANSSCAEAARIYSWWDSDFSLSTAELWAMAWKRLGYFDNRASMLSQVRFFTEYGYNGGKGDPKSVSLGGCSGNPCQVGGTQTTFDWYWKPLRNPL